MDNITLIAVIEIITDLNNKYAEERMYLHKQLNSENMTMGGETSTKIEIAKLEGKNECLTEMLDNIKKLTNA